MNAMDAEVVVSTLVEKLQKESAIIPKYPVLVTQVQAAIRNLNLLKRRIKVAEDPEASGDDQKVVQLLQALYSAEDAADTLLTGEAFQIKGKNSPKKKFMWWPCVTTFVDEFREYLSSYDRLVKMTSYIREVDGDTNDTGSSSQNDHKGQQSQQPRWGRISDFCLQRETDVVGFQEEINKLVNLALIPDQRLSSQVIAVVGERGSGKTTLVRTVYNKLLVKRQFFPQAWVNVRSLFKPRYILVDLLKQIQKIPPAVDETVSEEELIAELTKNLKDERYHIVVEDVDSHKVWEALRRILCSSLNSGSIITITTRNENIASSAADSILTIGKLNNEESWKLFLKEVQKARDISNKSDQLMTFKKIILELCSGLPLRIVLLGGLLCTKELSQWSRVLERAKAKDILALSYQELPPPVKPCFLYMGLFPCRFEIPVRRLIHLWLAEGFVAKSLDPAEMDERFLIDPSEPAKETVAEDMAQLFLEELVVRNMMQVTWRLDGTPKTCCMPGLLYDTFSPKAADVGFFCNQLQSCDDSCHRQPQFAFRRLATRIGIKSKFQSFSFHHLEKLRSYVAFDTRIQCRPATEIDLFLKRIITKRGFGLLKVLDLEGVYKPVLSDDAIGKLLLLSYLGLRSTALDFLPASVGNLPCLETLDVKHTVIHHLPAYIWKAKKLRHLYLNWSCSSNFRSSSLPSEPPSKLHTLWGLSIDDGGVGFLKTLTGIRKLGLTCTSESAAEATAEWVSQLSKLHSLKLRSISKRTFFDLKLPTIQKHQKLQDLYLLGLLSKIPLNNAEFPPNLRMLTLSGLELQDDPMPLLGRLPNLQILRLFSYSYVASRMTCPREAFPKLRGFKLWDQPYLTGLTVEEGAMPCLSELEIRRCGDFRRFTGAQHLTTLKKVALINTQLEVSDFVGSHERDLYIYTNKPRYHTNKR